MLKYIHILLLVVLAVSAVSTAFVPTADARPCGVDRKGFFQNEAP